MSDEARRHAEAGSVASESSAEPPRAPQTSSQAASVDVARLTAAAEAADRRPDTVPVPALPSSAAREPHAPEPRRKKRRVRSQPLAVGPSAVLLPPSSREYDASAHGPWRWTPVAAGLAALAWVAAIGLLVSGSSAADGRISSPRLQLVVAWGVAALLTFVPVEFRLGLPGLSFQGILGWSLLGYLLAFVPPPTGWLLELPDLPVYMLFFVALFFAVAAAALPFTYRLGRRMYARRMHQLDLRRARRQAYELGLLAVALMLLAALRVLMPLTGLLVIAVFVLVETLLLSQVAPES